MDNFDSQLTDLVAKWIGRGCDPGFMIDAMREEIEGLQEIAARREERRIRGIAPIASRRSGGSDAA